MSLIIIISYSYPPDNSPAAHRPYEFANYLEKNNIPFKIFSKHGCFEKSTPALLTKAGSTPNKKKESFYFNIIKKLEWFIEIDKAIFWGIRILPRVCFEVLKNRFKEKTSPIIWATSPGVTNLYIGLITSTLTFSKLHIDIRDAAKGISSNERMSILTYLSYKKAKSITSVTRTLSKMIQSNIKLNNKVATVFNGISKASINTPDLHIPSKGRINLSYAGALYGGDRPVSHLIGILNKVAEHLIQQRIELHLNIVSREDLSELLNLKKSNNLHLNISPQIPKKEALEYSAKSDINIVLIGNQNMHKCGIPLKVFDLLGIGRPILMLSPEFSDAAQLLKDTSQCSYFTINTDDKSCTNLEDKELIAMKEWILEAQNKKTMKNGDYLSSNSSKEIHSIITSAL